MLDIDFLDMKKLSFVMGRGFYSEKKMCIRDSMLLCIFRVIISRMMKKMSLFKTPVLIVACSPVILYLGSIWAAG